MLFAVSRLKYTDENAAIELRKNLIHPVVKRQKGCRSVQLLKATDGSGEYLILIAWDSKKDRDAFIKSDDHAMLKENQWPLMSEKIQTKEYELVLD